MQFCGTIAPFIFKERYSLTSGFQLWYRYFQLWPSRPVASFIPSLKYIQNHDWPPPLKVLSLITLILGRKVKLTIQSRYSSRARLDLHSLAPESTTVHHAPCQWEKGGSRSRKSCYYSDWSCWGFCFGGAGGWKRSEGVTWEGQSDWICLIIFLWGIWPERIREQFALLLLA